MSTRRPEVAVVGPKMLHPQVFAVVRNSDETGVSGTGTVIDGIVFPSGDCVTRWRGPTPCVSVWPSFAAFKSVHIDPHPDNNTEVRWFDVQEPAAATE